MRRRALLSAGAAGWATACAPLRAPPTFATTGSAGPRLEADALVSFDGARLPLRRWAPPGEPWAVVVALHGMNDYAQAFHLAGPVWAEAGVLTLAYDQRGFGGAPARGVWAGEAAMAADLRCACALARARWPGAVLAVVGESMGGAVAVAASTAPALPPPDCDRLVLSAPAVWGWGAQDPLSASSLWLLAHAAPAMLLTAPEWLARRIRASDNVEELRRMGRDPLMIFDTRADTTYGLMDLMQGARARIGRLPAPGATLMLYGAHDDLVPKPAAFFAAARLRASGGRTAYYPEGRHLLTRDLGRARVLEDVLGFLRNPAAPLPSAPAPIPATRPRGGGAPLARGAASA